MGEAARLLERNPKGEFRDMIHDEVDKWVDQIIDEVFEEGKEPTVMESADCFPRRKRSFLAHVFKLLLSKNTLGYWSRNTPLARNAAKCVKSGAKTLKRW